MTLALIRISARRKYYPLHLFPSQLERTAQGALIPCERQGEFEARQIIIHGDLTLDPLGIEDIQEAGGALAKAERDSPGPTNESAYPPPPEPAHGRSP